MLKPKESKKSKTPLSPCDTKRILQAISILKQLNQKYYENREKKPLLDDESENPVILQLTMKKIPPSTMQKFIKVHLPKSLLTDQNEVCLITGDLDKRNTKAEVEPDVLHFKEMLKRENISQVNEVITLRQLRKEYKPFEARRQLCGAYDVFLCDKKVAGVLPHTLGKCFFKKRKLPIQINMSTPNLKQQIENALSSTVFHITCKGNSCASEVAHLSMSNEDILSNVMSSIDALKEELPGQWNNVLGIYVKTPKSKAIPLYMSNDNPNDFNFGKKRTRAKAVSGELSTLSTEVKVFRDGRVVVKKPKKGTEDSDAAESDEEFGSNDSVKQSEAKMEETSFPSASDGEEVNSNTCPTMKPDKKSKKRKSNLGFVEENSVSEGEEKEVENSNVEKLEKKSKKRKSNLSLNEENLEAEVSKEEVENSKIQKSGKKSKKHKSDVMLNEESSDIEVNKEVENSEIPKSKKKNKKLKSDLSLNEEISEIDANKEKVENSEIQKSEKKSKKHKSVVSLNESSEVAVIKGEVENSKTLKSEKKSKKRKSNTMLDGESTEVANEKNVENFETGKLKKKSKSKNSNFKLNLENSEIEIIEEKGENSKEVKPGKKTKKCKSNTGFNNESTEVAVKEEKAESSKVKLEKKSKNQKSDLVPKEESKVETKENVKSLSVKRMKSKRKTIN